MLIKIVMVIMIIFVKILDISIGEKTVKLNKCKNSSFRVFIKVLPQTHLISFDFLININIIFFFLSCA